MKWRRKLWIAVVALTILATFWLWTPDQSRAVLERQFLAQPDDMVMVASTPLHVRDDGPENAAAIIMLHGFGASLHTWEPLARELVPAYRVIRLDLPGSGLSPPDATNDYRDERVISLLLELMDDRDIQRAVLVGNSIGGRIAWRAAAMHPERFSKLVLIAPDGFASPGFEYGKAPEVPALMGLMRYVLPRSLLQSNLEQSYGDPALLSDATVYRYHQLMLAPGSRRALLERLEQTVLIDPRTLLRGIDVPVLLLWGEKDALIPVSNAQDYLEYLPNAQLVSFPQLGHVPHEEAPQVLLQPLLEFLASEG